MPTVFIDGVAFKHGLPGGALSEALALVEVARADTNKRFEALLEGIKTKSEFLQDRHGGLLIDGHDARLASAIAANKKLKESLRQPLEQCLAAPSLLDFTKPFSEPVPVCPVPKKSGGVRMIHKPGLLHRTAQDMVLRIMGAYYAPRPFQYTHLGVPRAIAKIKDAVVAGKVYTARLDIKAFYPSFDLKKLVYELPLPKGVVEHVVVGRHMKVVWDQEGTQGQGPLKGHAPYASLAHHKGDLLLQARLGLPQGSACSPIVGAHIMSRLEWSPTPDVMLINYVDDFLLLSPSLTVLDEAVDKLTDAVADLPGGHFELKLKEKRDARKGFAFLGHRLQIVDGELKTSPTEQAIADLWQKLERLDKKLSKMTCGPGNWGKHDKREAIKALASMAAKIDGWLSAFRECGDAGQEVDFLVANIAEWCHKLGITQSEVLDAIEPTMGFRPNNYGFRASIERATKWSIGSTPACYASNQLGTVGVGSFV